MPLRAPRAAQRPCAPLQRPRSHHRSPGDGRSPSPAAPRRHLWYKHGGRQCEKRAAGGQNASAGGARCRVGGGAQPVCRRAQEPLRSHGRRRLGHGWWGATTGAPWEAHTRMASWRPRKGRARRALSWWAGWQATCTCEGAHAAPGRPPAALQAVPATCGKGVRAWGGRWRLSAALRAACGRGAGAWGARCVHVAALAGCWRGAGARGGTQGEGGAHLAWAVRLEPHGPAKGPMRWT